MKLTDATATAVIDEPIKQSIMVQRLEINFSEETKNFLLELSQAKSVTHGKCVARIEVDTEEIIRRIKEEYDITDSWIPVSERLPSEKGWYLITVQDINRFVDVDYYYGNSEWDEVLSKQEIIAWMPLPKPYREDSEK